MEKKWLVAFFAALLGLSGCGGKRTQPRRPKVAAADMPVKKDDVQVSFFDGDSDEFRKFEAFVLDEEPDKVAQEELQLTWGDPPSFDEDTRTVQFDYDSYSLKDDQKVQLAQDIEKRKESAEKGETICVKGHSCKWHGTRTYNLALSENRAKEVAKLYEEAGIPVKTFGVGNEEPIAFEMTKNGQAPNRRVEVYALAA